MVKIRKTNQGQQVSSKLVGSDSSIKKSVKAKNSRRYEVEGFKVLEWRCKQDSPAVHHFFIKAHQNVVVGGGGNNPKKPNGKTLLVINIPPFISQENLKDLFEPFGKITQVFVHQNPTSASPSEPDDLYFPQVKNQIFGYRVAYIVFHHPKSVSAILGRDPTDSQPLVLENCTKIQSGLNHWIGVYNRKIVESTALEAHLKVFMEAFDRQESKRKKTEENNEGQPDDDGWITVSRTGPRSGIRRTEQTEEKLKEKKRRSEKNLLNFTPLQIKETRAKQLADLKKKFDEDKQRVAMMKQQRKFNPFRS